MQHICAKPFRSGQHSPAQPEMQWKDLLLREPLCQVAMLFLSGFIGFDGIPRILWRNQETSKEGVQLAYSHRHTIFDQCVSKVTALCPPPFLRSLIWVFCCWKGVLRPTSIHRHINKHVHIRMQQTEHLYYVSTELLLNPNFGRFEAF